MGEIPVYNDIWKLGVMTLRIQSIAKLIKPKENQCTGSSLVVNPLTVVRVCKWERMAHPLFEVISELLIKNVTSQPCVMFIPPKGITIFN